MTLTEQFKKECQRIIDDWKRLLFENWGKISHIEMVKWLDGNRRKVLNDPFFRSFEDTRTLEETKHMARLIIDSYSDKKQGIGWYLDQLYHDKTPFASSVMFYIYYLREWFLISVNNRLVDWIEEEAKTKSELTTANNKNNILTNEKNTLDKDKKTAETNLKTAQDEKAELAKLWGEVVNSKVDWGKFDKVGIKEVGERLNDYNDMLRGSREAWEEQGFTKYGAKPTKASIQKLKEDLESKEKNQEKHTDYDKIKDDLKLANDKINDLNSQLSTANNSITDLTTEIKTKDKTINDLNHSMKDKDKIIADDGDLNAKIKDLNKQLSDKDAELSKRNETIKTLTDNLTKQEKETTQGNEYLKKLLEVNKAEIKKRTEYFYQDLSLDNNWVNEKYGDADKNYQDLLTDLNGESKPQQVINAFKIVALIVATEKAQRISDKMKEMGEKLPPTHFNRLKANNLNYFQKIKGEWDFITEKPTKENNPLYAVDDYTASKNKISTIIQLWQ